jgi:hypothetical protein
MVCLKGGNAESYGGASMGKGITDLAIQLFTTPPKLLWIVLLILPSVMVLPHTKSDLPQLPNETSRPNLCGVLQSQQ